MLPDHGSDELRDLRMRLATEIEHRKRLESQLLRAQRLESIGMLASGIAHDLNNMLSPITMAVPLLRLGEENPGHDAILDVVENSAIRATGIVKQVLTFARGLESDRCPINPVDLIREMRRMVCETFPRNISIETRLIPGMHRIFGDPTQLEQVLMNLCVNARDAMPNGGTLIIYGDHFTVDESYSAMRSGCSPGVYVLIRVADTGTGIPKEVADRIFEPFFTTKPIGRGTGLGLATVSTIVRGHGGFVSVETEVGKGTEFSVFLPACLDEKSATPEAKAKSCRRGNGELILIVDDEQGMREITAQILQKFGYRAITACDGAEAVVIYGRRAQEIAVVVTDVMMPIVDGVTLCRTLKRMNPGVALIACSGQAETGRLAELEKSTIACLTKPFTAETLLTAVHGALNLTAPAPSGQQSPG